MSLMPEAWARLLQLAQARYPDFDPQMAVGCYLSDRQRAGLGALDRRPIFRRPRPLQREKHIAPRLSGGMGVFYRWSHHEPPSREYVDADAPGREYAQTRVVPAIDQQFEVVFDARDLHAQDGRDRVARYLRRARGEVAARIRAMRGAR